MSFTQDEVSTDRTLLRYKKNGVHGQISECCQEHARRHLVDTVSIISERYTYYTPQHVEYIAVSDWGVLSKSVWMDPRDKTLKRPNQVLWQEFNSMVFNSVHGTRVASVVKYLPNAIETTRVGGRRNWATKSQKVVLSLHHTICGFLIFIDVHCRLIVVSS